MTRNEQPIKVTKHWSHNKGTKQRSWYKNRVYFCVEQGKTRPPLSPGKMSAPFYNSGGGASFISNSGMDRFLSQYDSNNRGDWIDSLKTCAEDIPGSRYVFDQLIFSHGLEFVTEEAMVYFKLRFS
jgi:hypothetical protein